MGTVAGVAVEPSGRILFFTGLLTIFRFLFLLPVYVMAYLLTKFLCLISFMMLPCAESGTTIVQEFHIFCNNALGHLLSSLIDNRENIYKQRAVKLCSKLNKLRCSVVEVK